MLNTAAVEPIPPLTDADGVIRVVDTQVTLDTVIDTFMTGASPEEIAQDFPVHYLRHRTFSADWLRDRLLARLGR